MTFHMWRRSSMRVILCGRRSIWWGWMVTPVALRIVNDVSYVTTIKHRVILCGRRSIWWGWMVTPVAPRIVNDVSYVTTIKHASHSVWQARYLVRLEGDTCCSAHCKWRFICDQDQTWESFCLTGAIFGEAQVSLFVAGTLLGVVLE